MKRENIVLIIGLVFMVVGIICGYEKGRKSMMNEMVGVTVTNCTFAEPNESAETTFMLISSPNIISVEFSAVNGRIICDSTPEEFLETLPYYLYWTLYNIEPNNVPVIEWADPNEVKE